MKALVAGGAGFIGSHLCEALLAGGHEVACVDNFSLGSRGNVRHLLGNGRFAVYEADICREGELEAVFEREKPEHVFHLAANSDIRASAENPEVEYRNTYGTTFRLLSCMGKYGVRKLFFASTSAVYGDRRDEFLSEESAGLSPISYYGAAKLGSEALISAFSHMNGLRSLVFRFPNVIGPRLTHGVVFDFIHKLRENPGTLRILGDGRQSKPYLYVTDLVEAIVRFMDVGTEGVSLYNVGAEGETSVARIADIVCEEMGLAGVRYEFTGGEGGWKGDVPRFRYCLDKIHVAGWRAGHASDEAVRMAARDNVSDVEARRDYMAVIQAGGKGTRMAELTGDRMPKPMLLLGGRPMLEWQVVNTARYGIREFVVIVGHLGEQIREYLGDGSHLGVHIRYIEEAEPLGSGGALRHLGEFARGSGFLLLFGDVMFDVDFHRMVRFHESHGGQATLLAHPNSHPHDSDLLLLGSGGCVEGILPKGRRRDGWHDNCVNAGIYIFSWEILRSLPEKQRMDLERDILTPLIGQGKAYAYRTPEYVRDAGTPERFRRVEEEWRKGIWERKNLGRKQRCVFLDRDGTLNRYQGLVCSDEQLELEEGAADAVRRLNGAGFLAIVVTNQPVVARGMCKMEDVERIHRKLQTLLGERGAYLDDIAFCPHHPDKGYPEEDPAYKIPCGCRKPSAGMVDAMAEKYNIDLSASFMVGDSTTDMQTGKNAGLRTILVATGQGGHDGKYGASPDGRAKNLMEAVDMVLARTEDVEPARRERADMVDYKAQIRRYIELEKRVLDALPLQEISDVMNVLEEARMDGRRIFVCGNGGSASTASHLACDFNKGASHGQPARYDVECLADSVPLMTAVANDIAYEDVFVEPLKNKLRSGDVVIGISGSGNSENVVRAFAYANGQGALTVALTGYDGGRLKKLARHNVHVAVDNMQVAEDVHLALNHMMMYILSGMGGC